MKKTVLSISLALLTATSAYAAKPPITTDVPLSSPYYGYIEKLEAMGYVESMPTGAKPYSRADMAKWVLEAKSKAATKPLPKYLQAYLQELENGLAAEIAALQSGSLSTKFALRELAFTRGYVGPNNLYAYNYANKGPRASWQPLNNNNNGYRYGSGLNAVAEAQLTFNLGSEFAAAITPRISYDKEQHAKVSLTDAYIKTRLGNLAVALGKEPLQWGQGNSGTLGLSSNATPLTMLKLGMVEPIGLFGGTKMQVFYAALEGNRAELANGKDFNDPGMVGMRIDINPMQNLTFALNRYSLLGGKGRALNSSDWGKWIFGLNHAQDKWDDRAGVDFRVRLPGVQFYGEVMGEERRGILPCYLDYRIGVYFPQLSKDGSWDLLTEYAHTTDTSYRHSFYTLGWTYKDAILGDYMGSNAQKLHMRIQKHFSNLEKVALYITGTNFDRSRANNPTAYELRLAYDRKLRNNMFLGAELGYMYMKNAQYQSGHSNANKSALMSLRVVY